MRYWTWDGVDDLNTREGSLPLNSSGRRLYKGAVLLVVHDHVQQLFSIEASSNDVDQQDYSFADIKLKR